MAGNRWFFFFFNGGRLILLFWIETGDSSLHLLEGALARAIHTCETLPSMLIYEKCE